MKMIDIMNKKIYVKWHINWTRESIKVGSIIIKKLLSCLDVTYIKVLF